MSIRKVTSAHESRPEPRLERQLSRPWIKPLVAGSLLLAVTGMIYLVGIPTTLSIGGGVALIIFGMLWPMLWIASLLSPKVFPFIRPQHSPEYASSERPHITILAPARNEEPVAERLVAQFKDQDYDNWTLVVIANNCTDNTAEVARRAGEGDPRIKVIEATFENGVKADALNLVLPDVEGDVVLELDSDNQVPSDLLSKIAKAFSDPEVMAVQTQIRAYNAKDSLLAAFQDLEFLIYSEIWNRGRAALGMGSSIGGTGFAARTYVLKQLNGWTRDLVEDFEMHTRLVAHGIKVTYLPWAWVYDEKPISWDALIKQRKRWIRGHLEIAARRSSGRDALGVIDQMYLYSPLFVALAMSLLLMGYLSLLFPDVIRGYSYFSPWFWLVSLGLMISALGTTVLRARASRLLVLILPYLLFFTFHWMVVFCTAVFPVSWGDSKTVHGVETGRGILPYIGVDGAASAKMFSVVLAISIAWMSPLFQGLSDAPSPFEVPVLQAGRSIATAMAGASVLEFTVQGTVRDPYDRPVGDATIAITSTDGGTWTTQSNSDGRFLVPSVGQGTYTIEISKSGYQTAKTTFEMPTDSGVWVSATLAKGGAGVVVIPIPY